MKGETVTSFSAKLFRDSLHTGDEASMQAMQAAELP